MYLKIILVCHCGKLPYVELLPEDWLNGNVCYFSHYKRISLLIPNSLSKRMASPADLVKVQVQMEGRRRLMGLKPRVNGSSDGNLFTAYFLTPRRLFKKVFLIDSSKANFEAWWHQRSLER